MDAETRRVTNETAQDVVQRDKVAGSETTMQYGDKIIHNRHWGVQRRPRIKVSSNGVIRSSWSSAEMMVERWKVKLTWQVSSQLDQTEAEDVKRIEARMLHRDALVAPAVLATSIRLKFKWSGSRLLIRARLLCLHTARATLRAY